MNLVYLDESGNTGLNLRDKQQPIFLLAAIIVPSNKWLEMEMSFNSIIKSYLGEPIDNIEIHLIDLNRRSGVFKNMSIEQSLKMRDEFLQLLLDYNIPLIYQSINKKKYELFCEDNYGSGIKINPYIMSLPFVCMSINQLLIEKGELGMLMFDEQKESFSDAEKSLKTLRLDPESALKTTNIIEKGFFVDSKKSFALQLVDMVAFYARKAEEYKIGIKVNDYYKRAFSKIELMTIEKKTSKFKDILEWVKSNHLS